MLYEPPFNPDDSYPLLPESLAGQLTELVAAGRRGDAVELYQTQAVGIPEDVVTQMRHAPFRPALEAIARTLAYDAAIMGDRSLPTGLITSITAPALVISGEQSPPFLRAAARAVAQALPKWAARQPARPRPRHQPGSHRTGHGRVPRQLAEHRTDLTEPSTGPPGAQNTPTGRDPDRQGDDRTAAQNGYLKPSLSTPHLTRTSAAVTCR